MNIFKKMVKKVVCIFIIDIIIGCFAIIMKATCQGIHKHQSGFTMDLALKFVFKNPDDWLLFSFILCILYFFRFMIPIVMDDNKCEVINENKVIKFIICLPFLFILIINVIFYSMNTLYFGLQFGFLICTNLIIGCACLVFTPDCNPKKQSKENNCNSEITSKNIEGRYKKIVNCY